MSAQAHPADDEGRDNVVPFPSSAGHDEQPTTAPAESGAVVGPVLHGELVDAPPVPPTVLPPWLRDRATASATVRWAADFAGRHALFHLVRLPVYGARIAWWTVRGAVIAVGRGWRWITARDEFADEIRAHRTAGRLAEARELNALRREVRRGRMRLSAVGLLVGAGGIGAAWVWLPAFGTWATLTSFAAVGGAAWLGHPVGAPIATAAPSLPTRVDMTADMLTAALRAAGLVKGEATPALVTPILRDGRGWATTFDLPRGGGKTAADVLSRRDTVAAELGVDEIQVLMWRVRAAAGGHAGRVGLWVADDDPYLGTPTPSPLVDAPRFSIWEPIPFGQDARGRRIDLSLMWQSMFFGGLPRRGKTFAQRLPSAAGVLDPWVRHYVADGKGGADWMPMRSVAHRLVIGAEDEAIARFIAMVDELIVEMGRRFTVLGSLPMSVCPEGKLTPEISRKYDMPVTMITIDELQEYLSAMDSKTREEVVEKLCRLARRAPAAGFILNAASQRPDADSVPTKLREIITYRYCTQVVDRTSSDMVLGKGKAAQGADASILSEDHKGVGVLVTGPGSFEIPRCDFMDVPTFAVICARGRVLRQNEGTLTGDAAEDTVAAAEAAGVEIPPVLADVLYVMHGVARMHTTTILDRLANADEHRYGGYTPERLAVELERAGVERTGTQVKIDGTNRAGYRRADLEAAVPAGATLPRPTSDTEGDGVKGEGSTRPATDGESHTDGG
ncbi:S-DNA-T family DNA segregation ATPase FtsK/SpoIIIE [Actinoalloteichus hoggarensis]|uniref:FtsK/SpoIIIE family protein n=1 Tax=Actinoalloteichus hoggarensis TaxID=1470176 RepID=A0A221W5U3_9PSEU|nr:hypothetical protein [Actinoalloteichus hoggarensis]ASO21056.1 FtsK/SpoIIIE family protein [Actinoalloteichus hoggarensis]MBB5920987.1 S-DNA-T family DNA segregation ATPase FtsK/SpoIIIE [Actinoalloteichus hoggarensis]